MIGDAFPFHCLGAGTNGIRARGGPPARDQGILGDQPGIHPGPAVWCGCEEGGDPGRGMRLGLNKAACDGVPDLEPIPSRALGGRLEWVFVTDSESDPVLPLLERCTADLPEEAQSRVVVLTAGKSSTTSQKIHKCAGLVCSLGWGFGRLRRFGSARSL